MRIDIWSDVICPFCWIGKRHLETALYSFRTSHPATDLAGAWGAYVLDSDAPVGSTETSTEVLSRKYGMPLAEAAVRAGQEQVDARFSELGLEYDWRSARISSTFDAHRPTALAGDRDRADEVEWALSLAHVSEGRLAVSGAQPVEVFTQAPEQAMAGKTPAVD